MDQLIGRRVQFPDGGEGVIVAADSVSLDVQPDAGGEVCRVMYGCAGHADSVVLLEDLEEVSKANPNADGKAIAKARAAEAVEHLVSLGNSKTAAKKMVSQDGAEAVLAARDAIAAVPASEAAPVPEKKDATGGDSAAVDGAAPGAAMVAG